MKKLVALGGLMIAPFVLAAGMKLPAIVLALVALGFTSLINNALPVLAAVLGVIIIFGAGNRINVDFVPLFL